MTNTDDCASVKMGVIDQCECVSTEVQCGFILFDMCCVAVRASESMMQRVSGWRMNARMRDRRFFLVG